MSNGTTRTPLPQNEQVLEYRPASPEKVHLKAALKELVSTKTNVPLVIAGEERSGTQSSKIVIPHQHQHVLAEVAMAATEDVKRAIQAAVSAQKEWSAYPWSERAAVFLRAAELLAGPYRAKINAATMLGQSKTCYQAEIDAACELIDFFRFNAHFAQKIYDDQGLISPRGQWNRSQARALEGFVYAIGPFNFTSISVNLATAPALMGCSVLWKPARQAILASYFILQLLEEAGLPPGVINLVSGDSSMISKEALASPDLAGIHFTGSTEVFSDFWREVGSNVSRYRSYPRLVGETGGKDFVFAHASADPNQLIAALIRGSFEYQGQKCSASSRLYVPKPLWQKIRPELTAQIEAIKMGDPEDFTNFCAAVIDAKAFQKIKGYIDRAKTSADAQVIIGGQSDDRIGYFIAPTVIETVNPRYQSMVEEIFGPVLTVYPYDERDFEKVVSLCDASTPYALTGAVFARDRKAIDYLSKGLVNAAGNFYINDKPTGAVVGQQPFGGARGSGTNDKAGSTYNLLRWVNHRSIKENFLSIHDYRYPHMQEF